MRCMPFGAMALILASATAAHARECKNVSFPEHIQLESTPLALNGLGMRKATLLKINVYVAALYLPAPTSDPQTILTAHAPSELVLQFVRNVGAGDLKERWSEGFAKNSPGELRALEPRIATFNSFMADIKTGQRMTFVHFPGRGIQVDINGSLKGTIPGEDFARAFLAIWFGADPPNPELKSGLLGGSCG